MRLVGHLLVAGGEILRQLRHAVMRVYETIVDTESVIGESEERDAGESVAERSMADFALETGLTPEEYVLKLLEENEGKLRQQKVISEMGLSRSSASRLLCGMEEDGQIRRVRIGSENEIYLPDSVPDLARPFDHTSTADI